MKIFINFSLAASLIIAIAGGSAYADEGGIELKMVAEQEIETTNEDGKKVIKRIEPKLVTPGDDVIYTTHYNNKGSETAESVNITNPVPEHMTYLAGTAEGQASTITYSVDGGKSFANASQLMVSDEDGKSRPASAKDYTHIRWTLDSLSPGSSGQVSFKAKLD